VSLLLDALKRAEQEKLARSPADMAPPARERPAPPAASAPSLELQPLGSLPGGSTLGHAPRHESAATAQAVFQAKSGGNGAELKSRGMLWATVGAIAVVVIAAGSYVWYSINSLMPKQVAATPRQNRPSFPVAPVGSPPQQALPTVVDGSAPPTGPATPATMAPILGATIASAPSTIAAAPVTPTVPVASTPPPRSPGSREELVAQMRRDSSSTPLVPPLRLDRTAQAPRRVPADVAAGYEGLRNGDLAAARRGYSSAIAAEPVNLDAQLGLATVEARSGNRTTAATHYRRALEIDPRNSTALAGLAALSDLSRPEGMEGKLRGDLSVSPESGPLHFTLGNVYAAQGRWNEAQLEYFEAHRLDPGNADVAFNLAVSLDNLGQGKLAASFYARALDLARTQAGQFETAAAARRLSELR